MPSDSEKFVWLVVIVACLLLVFVSLNGKVKQIKPQFTMDPYGPYGTTSTSSSTTTTTSLGACCNKNGGETNCVLTDKATCENADHTWEGSTCTPNNPCPRCDTNGDGLINLQDELGWPCDHDDSKPGNDDCYRCGDGGDPIPSGSGEEPKTCYQCKPKNTQTGVNEECLQCYVVTGVDPQTQTPIKDYNRCYDCDYDSDPGNDDCLDCNAEITVKVTSEFRKWKQQQLPASPFDPQITVCDKVLCEAWLRTIGKCAFKDLQGTLHVKLKDGSGNVLGEKDLPTVCERVGVSTGTYEDFECKVENWDGAGLAIYEHLKKDKEDFTVDCSFTGESDYCHFQKDLTGTKPDYGCSESTADLERKICFKQIGLDVVEEDEKFIQVCKPYDKILKFICEKVYNPKSKHMNRYKAEYLNKYDDAVQEIYNQLGLTHTETPPKPIYASEVLDGSKAGESNHLAGTMISLMNTIGANSLLYGYLHDLQFIRSKTHIHYTAAYKKDDGVTWMLYDLGPNKASGTVDKTTWPPVYGGGEKCVFEGGSVPSPLEYCNAPSKFCSFDTTIPLFSDWSRDWGNCWGRLPAGRCITLKDGEEWYNHKKLKCKGSGGEVINGARGFIRNCLGFPDGGCPGCKTGSECNTQTKRCSYP